MIKIQKIYCIYAHINKINNKVYVGQTCQKPEYRWNNGEGYKYQNFYKAIQKYGWNNFNHIILEENLSKEEVNEREKYWIDYYDSCNNGYNQTYGGSCHSKSSEETRKKLSEKRKGTHLSEETKRKISESHKGKKFSEEARLHMSESQKNRKLSQETKDKISQNNAWNVPVQCIETGEIFINLSVAGRWCGLKDGSHIRSYCNGIGKSAGKHPVTKQKLHWKIIRKETDNNDND